MNYQEPYDEDEDIKHDLLDAMAKAAKERKKEQKRLKSIEKKKGMEG